MVSLFVDAIVNGRCSNGDGSLVITFFLLNIVIFYKLFADGSEYKTDRD